LGVFHLELFATFLNLARLGKTIPAVIADLYPDDVLERTRDYISETTRHHLLQSSVSLALLMGFWWSGGFGWLQRIADSLGGTPLLSSLVAIALVALAQFLISLPFDIHSTFKIEAKHGFNRTTPATFIGDQFKSLLLLALLGLPLAAVIIWFFQTQSLAALYAWLVVAAFSILMTWLSPRLIMPLFLKFQPLPDGELRQSILALAEKLRFPVAEVSVVDGSRRSTKANAFFAGFGKTRRIALFDTLIEKHTPDEILAVLAHEIGHNKRRHVPIHLTVALAEMGLLFALLHVALKSPAFYHAFGVSTAAGTLPIGLGLILFGILYQPVSLLTSLLSHALSRKHEFEADAFAAQSLGTPTPLATGLKRLTTDHLAHPNPHPLTIALHYSHPPLAERLQALAASEGVAI
ncbi:MAG TPA: M48 family metallopeptidase, partial [Prosthecobacter sp.]|nr:M48 family metallopeptidase [Prosthecobacter sp.]